MADYSGVMVYCEVAEGKLSEIAIELLGGGKKLAQELGHEINAVVIGHGVGGAAQEAVAHGTNKVYAVDNPLLEEYQTDAYTGVMEKIVNEVHPRILIIGYTSVGCDLAPRLAMRLSTEVCPDCVKLGVDPDSHKILLTRPVNGGIALATFSYVSYPQIATVRAKRMAPLNPDSSRQGQVIHMDIGVESSVVRTALAEKVRDELAGIKLEDASVIVSGGRGIGEAEGFRQLEELAQVLHGAVGASRPACDNGWVSSSKQVGITGKTVSPDLYIAVGISGSSAHLSGCSNSKVIVAVNRDPEAGIFRHAHFGVVGDWRKVVPALTDKLKELLAGGGG